eukprot:TRINITY_DN37389_c0_g1_i1.p1 TRINITY_DN37389_c0_g1~~TRINITY_DN37389_c0_g1_i1.p1  ORF type:complete len:228 (+),score=59.30 TRINITY_DN37389_c0_g1_i1:186-869(+)
MCIRDRAMMPEVVSPTPTASPPRHSCHFPKRDQDAIARSQDLAQKMIEEEMERRRLARRTEAEIQADEQKKAEKLQESQQDEERARAELHERLHKMEIQAHPAVRAIYEQGVGTRAERIAKLRNECMRMKPRYAQVEDLHDRFKSSYLAGAQAMNKSNPTQSPEQLRADRISTLSSRIHSLSATQEQATDRIRTLEDQTASIMSRNTGHSARVIRDMPFETLEAMFK